MLSIKSAAAQGIERVRKPNWANKYDHIRIDILEGGKPGPWTHLFSPMNMAMNKRDPVSMIFSNMEYEVEEYEPYAGPPPESEEYKGEAEYFNKCMAE